MSTDPHDTTPPNNDLTGRVAIVTGGSRGIGLAVARALSAAGARVAICARDETAAEALASLPGEALYVPCDVTHRDAVEATVAAVLERWGELHILVNNAGVAVNALLLRTKPEQWRQVLAVNLEGAFHFSQVASRYLLRARERGRIVNITSLVGEQGNVGQAAYAASKAGLVGLTCSLARELASRGITVNAVSPGFIDTRMTEDLPEERRAAFLSQVPMGRAGTPDDVAGAVLFLCSDAAGYITGQVLRVNGGLRMA